MKYHKRRATRTRKFKEFKDRSEGPPLKTMVLKNDELSQYGERSKSKHRQPNTQKCVSDSETMFDGIMTQQLANTQKIDKLNESFDQMHEEFLRRMEKEDLCWTSKRWEHWTKEQDSKLCKLVETHSLDQIQLVTLKLNEYISDQMMPENLHDKSFVLKNENDCADRYLLLKTGDDCVVKQIKGNWTSEEDLILKQKVDAYGLKKWKEIATFLPGRIGKQCRERWYNNVDPSLNKDKWTVAEDIQLMELHKQYGNKWVQIQKFMPGRIDNDIKNRFNASLRKYKSFDEYLESIDKKRSKHKTGNTQNTLNQKNMFSQLDEWKNKYDLKNSASQANIFENDIVDKSEKSFSNDDSPVKKQRLKPRDEKCNRKQDEKNKRRIRKHSLDKTDELISRSCSDSEEKDVFKQLTQQLEGAHRNEGIARRKALRQFLNSEDKKMEESDIEEVIHKVYTQKKNDAHKYLHKASLNKSFNKIFAQSNDIHEYNDNGDPQYMDDEERRLVNNLLSIEPPLALASNKLLFRKLFRVTKYTSDEYSRKCKSKYCQSAFEVYTHVPPENTGPKVLYITAKSQDGKDKDSDVIKDIEGHAIEKIHTSKLSEKVLQEKWRLEEEELEKVRQARESLGNMRMQGASQTELVAQARHILMTKLSTTEFSGKLICMQSDKSDQTIKSFNHIGRSNLNESPTIGIANSQQRPSSSSQFPVKSKQRLNSKIMMSDDKNNFLSFETHQLFTNTIGGSQHPNGDPKNLTGNNSTFNKIFSTSKVTRNKQDKEAIVNLLSSISKNGSVSAQMVRNDTYNLRNHNAFYSSSSQNGHKSQVSKNQNQKIVQINKCGNTASISIIHPGGEKTTCMEKSNVLRAGKPNSNVGRSSKEYFQKRIDGGNSRSNTSQQGNKTKKAESLQNKRASPEKNSKGSKQPQDSKRNNAQSQEEGNVAKQLSKKQSTEKGLSKPQGANSSVQKGSGTISKNKNAQQNQSSSNRKSSQNKKGEKSQQQGKSNNNSSNRQGQDSADDKQKEIDQSLSKTIEKTASLTAQKEDCQAQIKLAEAGMKSAGQRNSVRIMARKLDQINKKIEQENSAKRKLRQKQKMIKRDSDTETVEEDDDEEEAEEEQEEEQQEDDEELEVEQEEQEDEQEEIKDDQMEDLSSQNSEQKNDHIKSDHQSKQFKASDKGATNKTLQEKLKRFELLKKIQNQLNQIKDLRGQKDKKPQPGQQQSIPESQRLNSSMTSQKQGSTSKDGKAPTTRYSTRLRDRTYQDKKKVLVGGKQLSNRAAQLKERDIRNKEAKERKQLENDYEHVTQDNRYNGFLAKELKLGGHLSRSFIQKQSEVKEKDQKMLNEQVENKTPKKDSEKPLVDQSHDQQNHSKAEYTGGYNMPGHYPHGFYVGNQFEPGTSMYTVMQQQPMFPPGPHQSQIGSPGFHQMMPGPNQYGQNYSIAPSYNQSGHFSQIQQLQQAQMMNDNFNRNQQPYPPPSMTPVHYSSYHETPSRKIEKLHEAPPPLRDDKPPNIDKRDGKEGEHNTSYNRSMMMIMLQQKMGSNNHPPPSGGQAPQSNQSQGLMPNLPPPPQPSGIYNYQAPQHGQNGQMNQFYPYQFNQNQPQVMAPHMQGQPISHHQLANMMPPGSSNMTNMTNLMGTSNNSINMNSMRLQEMNSGPNINGSPSKSQQPQAHRPHPPISNTNNAENDEKTLTQNSECEDVEMANKK